jgi:hypothetical protein
MEMALAIIRSRKDREAIEFVKTDIKSYQDIRGDYVFS